MTFGDFIYSTFSYIYILCGAHDTDVGIGVWLVREKNFITGKKTLLVIDGNWNPGPCRCKATGKSFLNQAHNGKRIKPTLTDQTICAKLILDSKAKA